VATDRLVGLAFAQGGIPNGVFLRDDAGTIWLTTGGKRAQVPIYPASNDAIGAIPDGGQWVVPGGADGPDLRLGSRPDFAGGPPPAGAPAGAAASGAATTDASASVVGHSVPTEPPNHVPQDAPLNYNTRPPTSGMHYPTWIQTYGMFDPAPPTGNWVHNLEHGAVVILYNCPDGCPDVVQQLSDLYPKLPRGRNAQGGRPRVLILPYTDMDTKIAAVSWGWLLQQDQLNPDELIDFVEQHVDRGPECVNRSCP
jgi:hypothetical protein